MASMSTNDTPADRKADVAAPLDQGVLARVPGVLGTISRERAADYAEVPVPAAPSRDGARPGRFESALRSGRLEIIAEVKRGSPSQGAIAELDPVTAAIQYQAGGAAALSVLTEPRHFGGTLEHLRQVATAVALPAMRKEFVVHPAQVHEAAQAGAAAVLLIAALLGEALADYLRYTWALGLDALVEVHDDTELGQALEAGSELIGVNNRDLRTLEIDRSTAPRLSRKARQDGFTGVLIAESGYHGPESLREVVGLADAALVGTALARSGDLESSLRAWRAALDGRHQ